MTTKTIGSRTDTTTDRTDRRPVDFWTKGGLVYCHRGTWPIPEDGSDDGVDYIFGPTSSIAEWIEYYETRASALRELLADMDPPVLTVVEAGAGAVDDPGLDHDAGLGHDAGDDPGGAA